jgi:hypothetical protein
MKYDRLTKCWPFLIAERVLKIQMSRLRHIKTAWFREDSRNI